MQFNRIFRSKYHKSFEDSQVIVKFEDDDYVNDALYNINKCNHN